MKTRILSICHRAGTSLHNSLKAGLVLALLAASSGAGGARAAAADLASAADPIVILKIADLHVTGSDRMAEFKQVIAFANAAIHPALTFVAGDTPHNGTLAEYQAYKQVRDTLRGPVFDAPGDHEAKAGGLEHYKKVLGDLTYSFPLGARWQIVGLNSMGVDDAQLEWARQELATAKAKNRTGLIFIHHNFADIKDKSAQDKLNALVKETGVKLVLAGHTHNNTVINDGAGLQITTTSIKEPRGSAPPGYAIITLDEGRAAWHYVPLVNPTIVAVCNPIGKLMTTGPEGVVSGQLALRAKVYSTSKILSVTATVDDGAAMTLSPGPDNLWTGAWDSTKAQDGEHKLAVAAANTEGWTATEEIVFLVNQKQQYTPALATASDEKAAGGKGAKGGPGPADKAPKTGKGKKQPLTASELPAAVKAALSKQAGNVEFGKLEKESKDGRDIFSAKWGPKETEREMKLAADGTLLEAKETLPFSTLPAVVRSAVNQAQPTTNEFECKKLSTFIDGRPIAVYEVRGSANGEKLPPLRISASGVVTQAKGGKAK